MHFSAICQRQSFRMLQRDRIQNVSEDVYRAGKDVRCLYGAHKGKKKGLQFSCYCPFFSRAPSGAREKENPVKTGLSVCFHCSCIIVLRTAALYELL